MTQAVAFKKWGLANLDKCIVLIDDCKPKQYIISMKKLTPHLADALFGKTRKGLIGVLFSNPERSWHLRELARRAGVSPTMLGKEADLLSAAGIILSSADGNRRVLRANPDCPIFDELRGIARKTAGIADVLRSALAELDDIETAFIFGSVAKGEERSGSDVDVCVIGTVAYRQLASALSGVESTLGRPVNPVLYTPDELRLKYGNENPFILGMLSSERIFLIGDQDGLDGTFGGIVATGAD